MFNPPNYGIGVLYTEYSPVRSASFGEGAPRDALALMTIRSRKLPMAPRTLEPAPPFAGICYPDWSGWIVHRIGIVMVVGSIPTVIILRAIPFEFYAGHRFEIQSQPLTQTSDAPGNNHEPAGK